MHRVFFRCLELRLTIYNLCQYAVAFFIRGYPLLNVQAFHADSQRLIALVGIVDLGDHLPRIGVHWVVRG